MRLRTIPSWLGWFLFTMTFVSTAYASFTHFSAMQICDGSCTAAGDATGDGDLYVEDALEVDGAAYFDGAVDMDSTLDVDGTATLDLVNICNGACTAASSATGDGDLYVEDGFEVDGASDLDGTLDVDGTATLDLVNVCDGACASAGVATGDGDLYVESDLEVDGTFNAPLTRYISIPATAMETTDSSRRTLSNNMLTLNFDPSSDENAYTGFYIPEDWDASSAFTVALIWTSTTTSNEVCWVADWASNPQDDTETAASDGSDAFSDTAPSATGELISTAANITLTAGTLAAGDWVSLNIYRDVDGGASACGGAGGDDHDSDALLFGAAVSYTASR